MGATKWVVPDETKNSLRRSGGRPSETDSQINTSGLPRASLIGLTIPEPSANSQRGNTGFSRKFRAVSPELHGRDGLVSCLAETGHGGKAEGNAATETVIALRLAEL